VTRLPCSAVLFDMDGTLVDSTAIVEAAWTRFGGEHGLDPAEILAFSHGRQTIDTITRFFPDLPDEERRRLAAELVADEVARTNGIVEVPGSAELVDAVVRSGIPIALVTSAPRDLAVNRMRAAGVAVPGIDVPGAIVTAEDVPRGKPAPDCYLLGAERLGVAIDECVAFEDAPAGLRAAVASGARVVVVGGHDSEVTDGLVRAADLTRVQVDGRVLIVD
jgi:mannitol-1-/sugar-/sorbitol-6-phosphatase